MIFSIELLNLINTKINKLKVENVQESIFLLANKFIIIIIFLYYLRLIYSSFWHIISFILTDGCNEEMRVIRSSLPDDIKDTADNPI